MAAKRSKNKSGIVYSTNPDFSPETESNDENHEAIAPTEQKIRIQLEKKHRGGKQVTIIYGFEESDQEIENIGKELKKLCGVGGSAKFGEIIIQGDFREKALQWLHKKGFTNSKII